MAGLALVSLRKLARPFAAGLVMWGVPLTLIGIWPHTSWTVACLAVVGAGNAVLDIAGFTLIQRGIDDAYSLGSSVSSKSLSSRRSGWGPSSGRCSSISWGLGPPWLFSILPVLTIFTFPRLRAIDGAVVVPERQLRMLQSIPLFNPLPPTTLERLAAHLAPVAAVAGTELVREGDAGDLFYIVEAGHVEVEAGGHVTDLGPGDYFGEIALLRDVPRSATCTATTNVELYTIDRERFVSAVTGNSTSASEIESVIHRRLGGLEAVA